MVVQKIDMRGVSAPQPPPDRMASPGQARSVVALYLAAGAQPEEIDGAVQVQIEMERDKLAPTSYADVARPVFAALAEYRRRQQTFTVVEEASHA